VAGRNIASGIGDVAATQAENVEVCGLQAVRLETGASIDRTTPAASRWRRELSHTGVLMATEIGRPNMAFSDVIFGGITIPMDTGLVTEDVAAAPTAAVEEETPAREDFIIFAAS
jgi:hypothetical protein